MPTGEIAAVDVFAVICDLGYHVEKMGSQGVVLMKNRHSFPILLPWGVESLPTFVVAHVVSHVGFDMNDFWARVAGAEKTRTAP